MVEYRFNQLVDIGQVRQLLESHHRLSKMAYGILDPEENILVAVGWQDVCSRFHRSNPISNARCLESNTYIHDRLLECDGDYVESQCRNGLIDAALPIIISGKHVATFYAGQFFYDDRPDTTFFSNQAGELGFDVDDYLASLELVPVFSRDYVRDNMLFLRNMVNVLAETGLNNFRLASEKEERKFTEQRLELLGFALDNVHEAAFLMDLSGRFHYVNQKACRSLGYTRDELLGMTIPDIDPDYQEESLPHVFDHLLEQGTHTFETRHQARDGRIFPVEITSTVLEHNGVRYNLALVRDITERKAAQAMLEDERLLLKTLIQTLPDPVWLKDVNGVYIACNAAFGRLYDDTPSGIAGRTDNDYVDDELAAFFQQKDREAIAAGRPRTNEEWVTYAADGHRALWETTKTPVYDAMGCVVGALGVARDITGRKEMEEALAAREQEFRTLAENSPDNIIRYDRQCRAVYYNPTLARTVALDHEDMLGKTPTEAHPDGPKVVGEYEDKIRHVLESGKPDEVEIFMPHTDGELHTHLVRFVAERDAEGRIIGVLAIGRDITDRKRMETALCASEQEFRTLAENAPDVIVRYDRECRRIYVNTAFARVNRLSPQEALGKTPIELSTELAPLAADFTQYLKEVLETGVPGQIDLAVVKDGIDSSWFVRLIPESDSSGEVVSALTIWTDITVRKRLETALRAREQEFRTLAENSPNIIMRYDLDCRRIYVNPAYERETQVPAQQALNVLPDGQWQAINMPVEEYKSRLRQVMATGIPAEMEIIWPHRDTGKVTIHALQVVAERNPDGRIVGCLAMGHNISAFKEAEQRLHNREQEFRALVENSPDYIARYDRDCRRIYINPALEKLFGRPAHEQLGMGPTERASLPDAAGYEQAVRGVLESGKECQMEFPFRSAEGEHKWGHMRIVPEFDRDGNVATVLAIGRDITERKLMEKELRASEQRFRDIFDNSLDCLYLLEVTEEGRFRNLEINPAFERSTGMTRAELIGKYVDETVSEEMGATVVAKYRRCVAAGTVIEEEIELDLPSGHLFFYSTLVPVPDESGHIHRIVGITRDITKRKRAEQQLQLMSFALDHVGEAVYLIDDQACFHYVNEEACRAMRCSRDELLARSIMDIDPDFPSYDWPGFWSKLMSHSLLSLERRHKAADGHIFPVEIVANYFEFGGQGFSLALARDITERKQMEEELAVREREFRTLTENSPNIIIRYNRECRRIYVNPAYESENGIRADQVINTTPDTLWRPTMPVEEYKAKLRYVMETGIPARILVEWPRFDDGRITCHAFHLVAECGSDGQVTGCLAIGHNITALKEAELRLSKLAAGVPGFLYTYRLRPDGTACLPYASPQIKDIYGFPPEAVTEDASETLARIHPEDVSRVRDSIAESARTLSLWQAEYRIRNPEKGDIWVEGRSMPEPQPDGGILWFGFVHDITERKRIETALQKSRHMLEEAQRIAHIGSWELDLHNNRLNWSDEIFRIFSIAPEQFGASYEAFLNSIHPDDRELVNRAYSESVANCSPYEIEHRLLLPDGSVKFVQERGETIYDTDSRPLRSIGTVQDITERKRIEESLHVKREQLSAMTVELSLAEERERRRIATELHDHIGQTLLLSRIKLGTLANVFKAGCDEETYEEVQTLLEQTIRDVRSLTQQLNPPLLDSVGLEAALEWLAKRMEADYSLQVDFVDDRSAKPLSEDIRAVVYQSARELLINVAKHAGTSEVRLAIGREADMLVLTVKDQGRGFVCTSNPGTNMSLDSSFGLFNVQQRIKLLGGDVVIESAPGRGTCATIRVPLAVG